MRRSGSHVASPSTSSHPPTSSNSPKSQLALPGDAAHSPNTESPSVAVPASTRSAAASIAARASFIAPAGCSAGTAARNSANPTENASNAGVGGAPVATIPADASPATAANIPANPPAMPALRSRTNCSGAPYVGSNTASSPSHPCPVSKSAHAPRSMSATHPPREPAAGDVSTALSGFTSRCTTPARCISMFAAMSPRASARHVVAASASGPSPTASATCRRGWARAPDSFPFPVPVGIEPASRSSAAESVTTPTSAHTRYASDPHTPRKGATPAHPTSARRRQTARSSA